MGCKGKKEKEDNMDLNLLGLAIILLVTMIIIEN